MDHPVPVESFTIPEAAEALGRSTVTIRRWIEADKIPEPYLEDTQYHWKVYSVGELSVIAGILARHEREFTNFVSEHTMIVETLHQAVHAFRAEHI